MKFFQGVTLAIVMSSIFWGTVIYISYHQGFKAGVESEKDFIAHAQLKLQQCNEVVARNYPKGIIP